MTGHLRAVAVCEALLLAGCAGGPVRPGGSAWHLPGAYQANQVVYVTTPEGPLDFLASVACQGGRVEVVLFDSALQVPLLRATAGPGGSDETVFVEGVPPGSGRGLAELIRTMNGLSFLPEGAATLGAAGDSWRFTLLGLTGEPACTFPGRIVVEHRYGGPRIEVETTDVVCNGQAR
jgi:hypothetical protein